MAFTVCPLRQQCGSSWPLLQRTAALAIALPCPTRQKSPAAAPGPSQPGSAPRGLRKPMKQMMRERSGTFTMAKTSIGLLRMAKHRLVRVSSSKCLSICQRPRIPLSGSRVTLSTLRTAQSVMNRDHHTCPLGVSSIRESVPFRVPHSHTPPQHPMMSTVEASAS